MCDGAKQLARRDAPSVTHDSSRGCFASRSSVIASRGHGCWAGPLSPRSPTRNAQQREGRRAPVRRTAGGGRPHPAGPRRPPRRPCYLRAVPKEYLRSLCDKIVQAQKPIRVLRAINWDPHVHERFFKAGARELPRPEYPPLGFSLKDKRRELREIKAADPRPQPGRGGAPASLRRVRPARRAPRRPRHEAVLRAVAADLRRPPRSLPRPRRRQPRHRPGLGLPAPRAGRGARLRRRAGGA